MTLFDGTYILDPTHSRVGFWVRHAMVTKMRGEFMDYESYIVLGDSCKIEAIIQTPSISTSNPDRDYHLLNEDFFETDKYPTITFFSTGVEWVHNYRASVTGDLTIKGETHPVTLDVHVIGVADDPMGNTRMGFEGYLKINRMQYNMTFNTPMESGGLILGEEVTIEIEGSAILQPPGTPVPDLKKQFEEQFGAGASSQPDAPKEASKDTPEEAREETSPDQTPPDEPKTAGKAELSEEPEANQSDQEQTSQTDGKRDEKRDKDTAAKSNQQSAKQSNQKSAEKRAAH